MHLLKLVLSLLVLALGPLSSRADMGSYFQFIQPTTGTEWVNGKTNPILWQKGLLDGVVNFDLEIARLSEDGVIFAALNVNANSGKLNLFIQDVPAGDDYYLLFINSTHGGMYAISPALHDPRRGCRRQLLRRRRRARPQRHHRQRLRRPEPHRRLRHHLRPHPR
ncbi:hypothetical protein EW145_g8219, partial [Phellinidium pouzarii]